MLGKFSRKFNTKKYIFTLFSSNTYIDQTFKNDNIEDQLLPNMP